jgi:hypothetical protein
MRRPFGRPVNKLGGGGYINNDFKETKGMARIKLAQGEVQ